MGHATDCFQSWYELVYTIPEDEYALESFWYFEVVLFMLF